MTFKNFISKYRKVCTIFLWVVPALIFAYIHSSHSGLKGVIDFSQIISGREISVSVSKTPSLTNSEIGSSTPNLFVSDQSLDTLLNNLGRFSTIIKAESNIFRYNLFVENNVLINVKYTGSLQSNDVKNKTFQTILSCKGKRMPFSKKVAIENNLYLGDRVSDDRIYVEKLMSDCLTNLSISAKNNTNDYFYLPKDYVPEATGTVSFLIKPDSMSTLFLFGGWLIAWSGLLILFREGILKSLKNKNFL